MTTWIRWSVCALALAFGLCAVRAQTGPTWRDEWLARFNRERAEDGVSSLRLSPVLCQVAQWQAEQLTQGGRRSLSDDEVSERLRRVGYSAYSWREHYEQAYEAPGAGTLFPLRRSARVPAALDGRFRDLGIGAAISRIDGSTFYVFLFGWHEGDYFASATARLYDRTRIASEMLSRINDVRRRAGLAPLVLNPLLDRVSQQHAEDMLARSYYGHWTPEGLGPSERARADGYRSGIGENIAEQRFSVEEALKAWMDSPGHRRNILDPGCREMGLGLAVGAGYDAAPGGYRVIWVQSFGRGN